MWSHSCFGFENANSIVPSGQRGTKNPSYSIIRNLHRYIFFCTFRSLLWNNQLLKNVFPKTFSKLKFGDFKIGDKNPKNLMKIYDGNKFLMWVEKFKQKKTKVSNSFICYEESVTKILYPAKIIQIQNESYDVSLIVQRLNLQQLHLDITPYRAYLFEDTDQIDLTFPQRVKYFFSFVIFADKQWIFPVDY